MRLQTVKKHPSKNPTGPGEDMELPIYFLKLHQTVKKYAEIRRNTQKHPSKNPYQYAEIPKQKHPYQYAEIPKQKHPKQKPYRAWGSKIGRKNRELNRSAPLAVGS